MESVISEVVNEENISSEIVTDSAIVVSNDNFSHLLYQTNNLLTMIIYLLFVFLIYFALHRFIQAKRRK